MKEEKKPEFSFERGHPDFKELTNVYLFDNFSSDEISILKILAPLATPFGDYDDLCVPLGMAGSDYPKSATHYYTSRFCIDKEAKPILKAIMDFVDLKVKESCK